nr:hypothetical protein Iba_chr12aCG12550 [Ipomoea batatas]
MKPLKRKTPARTPPTIPVPIPTNDLTICQANVPVEVADIETPTILQTMEVQLPDVIRVDSSHDIPLTEAGHHSAEPLRPVLLGYAFVELQPLKRFSGPVKKILRREQRRTNRSPETGKRTAAHHRCCIAENPCCRRRLRVGRPEGSFAAGVEDRRRRPAPSLLLTERNVTHRQALRRSTPLLKRFFERGTTTDQSPPPRCSAATKLSVHQQRYGFMLPIFDVVQAAASRGTVKTGEGDTGAASRTGLEGPPGRRRKSIVAPARRCGLREPSPPSFAVTSTREGKQGRFAGEWG